MKREFLLYPVREFERYSSRHEFDCLPESEQLSNLAIKNMVYDARHEKNERLRIIKYNRIEKLCIWYLSLYAE